MNNNLIPLNGRIAIVDDNVDQALPLMRVLAKNNIPYVFYKGNDLSYLPERPENDIRILFLDLNLIGGLEISSKNVRAILINTLRRIISPTNYPYVLILWSRQEKEYGDLLKDIFNTDLSECAPIDVYNYIKSNFFPNFTEKENTENPVDDNKIIEELNKILLKLPAYSYLMQWENCVHNSADATIQDLFYDFHKADDWHNNANYILDSFAHSYLEQHYGDASWENKAKAALMFLDNVYNDTLEGGIRKLDLSHAQELQHNLNEDTQQKIIAKINERVLLSKVVESIHQPGSVLFPEPTEECIKHYHELFNNSFSKNNLNNKEVKSLKEEIYKTLHTCEVIVTPDCDYAQNKIKYDRIVQGVIIESQYKPYIDNKSEAIYISPVFRFNDFSCIMVLNFRYFLTKDLGNISYQPSFKLRNRVLAEIQSKLARHINRQGIMNL